MCGVCVCVCVCVCCVYVQTHMPKKYEMKSFMEKEFGRRLLAKAMVRELQAAGSAA